MIRTTRFRMVLSLGVALVSSTAFAAGSDLDTVTASTDLGVQNVEWHRPATPGTTRAPGTAQAVTTDALEPVINEMDLGVNNVEWHRPTGTTVAASR